MKIGDRVKIRREVLQGHHQIFPVGTIVAVQDELTCTVELEFLKEEVRIAFTDLTLKAKTKKS